MPTDNPFEETRNTGAPPSPKIWELALLHALYLGGLSLPVRFAMGWWVNREYFPGIRQSVAVLGGAVLVYLLKYAAKRPHLIAPRVASHVVYLFLTLSPAWLLAVAAPILLFACLLFPPALIGVFIALGLYGAYFTLRLLWGYAWLLAGRGMGSGPGE